MTEASARAYLGALACLLLTSCGACGSDAEQAAALKDARRDYGEALAVFPGAQGFGSRTVAGRGGKILRVTSLSASGPGTLRAALEQRGPRTIIFEVGGVLRINEPLEIREPFVTIAGQTAPGPGVTVFGAGMIVSTHDVLLQHLHIRPGDAPSGPDFEVRDGLELRGDPDGAHEVYNVVIDHCSLSWGTDETFSTWYRGVHDVTLTNTIIAESLDDVGHPQGRHSKGLLVGDHTHRFSAIGNLLLHHDDRNPHIKGDVSALFANNVVYNYGRWPITLFDERVFKSGPSLFAAIGNVFIAGPDSPPEHSTGLVSRRMQEGTTVYLEDNRAFDARRGDPCSILTLEDGDTDCVTTDSPVSIAPLELLPSEEVFDAVLANVGAFPAARGPVDTRLLREVRARGGRIPDNLSQVGGLPEIDKATRSLQPPEEPAEDDDADGYTNLEEWLHTFPKP